MTTFVAQGTGLATNPNTWTVNGGTTTSIPTSGDSEQIGPYTVTYSNIAALAGNPVTFTGTGGVLAFDNGNGTAAAFASSLDGTSSVGNADPGSTNTVLFAGGLLNEGTIAADALGSGNLVIDGRALTLPSGGGVIGANFANTGMVSATNGNTLTISTSGTTDINGNTVTASSSSPAQFVNSGIVNAAGGIVRVEGNVVGNAAVGTTPEFNLSGNGTLEFGGSVAAGQTVNFAGANGNTLRLDDPTGFNGAVSNYGSVGDRLDIATEALTGVSYTNGVFSAQTGSGNSIATSSMAMSLTGATGVQLAGDGGSGTVVTSVYTNPGSTIANISALRENATITPASSAAQTLSEKVVTGGATTTYLDSNQLNFADGTDYYGSATLGGQADLLYLGLLGRTPDAASLGFYTTQLDNGASTAQVAGEITASAEYQAGNVSSTQLVNNLYSRLLGYAPDANGLAFWTGVANTNGQAAAAAAFVQSQGVQVAQNAAGASGGLAAGAFAANPVSVQVEDAYQTVLGRSADAAGLSYWTQQLEGGVTQADLLQSFIGSAEFTANASAQSNSGFVAQIETNTQGGADASGLAYWTNQLNTGAATKTDVASVYANSATLAQREAGSITAHGIVTQG